MGALFIVHEPPMPVGSWKKSMRDGMVQLGTPGSLFDLVELLEFLGRQAFTVGFAEPMFKATKEYMFRWELDTVLLASCVALALIGPGSSQ